MDVHSRDSDTWYHLQPMAAQHSATCGPPPATHTISYYSEVVYQCKNHLMTAIFSESYGEAVLTPSQMVDFSQGEAVIRFDLSTARASSRDWVDIWITPFEDNLLYPVQSWFPDLTGEPRNGVHFRMDFSWNSRWSAEVIRDFEVISVTGTNYGWKGYEHFLAPSAMKRETYELRISPTHLAFGMPDYNFWWVDTTIPELDWRDGVVQLTHHSYNPEKACEAHEKCGPTTWHWDNVSIDPARPFTMLHASRRYVNGQGSDTAWFSKPAPADSWLRFAGIGEQLEVSFDGGLSWQLAWQQAQGASYVGGAVKREEVSAEILSHKLFLPIISTHLLTDLPDETFKTYWMQIPEGVTTVAFRGSPWWGGSWHVRDIAIWSRTIEAP